MGGDWRVMRDVFLKARCVLTAQLAVLLAQGVRFQARQVARDACWQCIQRRADGASCPASARCVLEICWNSGSSSINSARVLNLFSSEVSFKIVFQLFATRDNNTAYFLLLQVSL